MKGPGHNLGLFTFVSLNMAKPRTLLDELDESSLFLTSLYGVRTVFERELGLKNILIETSEMIKLRILQRTKQHEAPTYPYAYMVINELQAVKELQPGKVVRRLGYRMGTIGATRATSSKGYIFPVQASVDLKYIDNNPERVIKVAEAMLLLGQVGCLFFDLVIGSSNEEDEKDGMRLEVRLEIPTSVTIPVADSEVPAAPGGMEVTLSFVVNTYAGFFRDVSAVHSEHPVVTTTLIEGLADA